MTGSDGDGVVRGVYHCVIYDVAFDLKIQAIASSLVPNPGSALVRALAKLGFRIVPHALHIYKEPLRRKFGFLIVHLREDDTTEANPEVIRRATGTVGHADAPTIAHAKDATTAWSDNLMKRWIAHDLATQLREHPCCVRLCQPPTCHDGELFRQALRQHCAFLSSDTVSDVTKMETFILSKIRFYGADTLSASSKAKGEMGAESSHADSAQCARHLDDVDTAVSAGGAEVWTSDGSAQAGVLSRQSGNVDDMPQVVGFVTISEFTTQELLFIKKNVKTVFPPVLVSSEAAQPQFDLGDVATFFRRTLSPFFAVQE